MIYNQAVIEEIREYNAFQLAARVGASPDSLESPGAQMLVSVRDAVLERLEYIDADDWETEMEEAGHEIADGAPSVYTFTTWQQFVDLGAWQADISELGSGEDDMTRLAMIALYEIARTLVYAIAQEITESLIDPDETDN